MKNKAVVFITIILTVCLIQPIAQMVIVEANPVMLPHILIEPLSPYRAVLFNTSNVELSIYVSVERNYTELDSVFYSLDGAAGNYALTVSKASEVTYETQVTLENLANGNHTINVYADFADGETVANVGTFIIDAPTVPTPSSSPSSNPTTNPTQNSTTNPAATPNMPEFPSLLIVIALMLATGSAVLLTLKRKRVKSAIK